MPNIDPKRLDAMMKAVKEAPYDPVQAGSSHIGMPKHLGAGTSKYAEYDYKKNQPSGMSYKEQVAEGLKAIDSKGARLSDKGYVAVLTKGGGYVDGDDFRSEMGKRLGGKKGNLQRTK